MEATDVSVIIEASAGPLSSRASFANWPSRQSCQCPTAAAQKARGRMYMADVSERAPHRARGNVALPSGTSAATMPAESYPHVFQSTRVLNKYQRS